MTAIAEEMVNERSGRVRPGPCSAPEFLAPRVKPAEFTTERGSLEGWQYTTRGYRPPAHFGEDVTIASFWFTPEQPGDAAINAVLAGSLPRGTVDDEFVDCLAGNISSFGTDGNFEKTAPPVLAYTTRCTLRRTHRSSNCTLPSTLTFASRTGSRVLTATLVCAA